jgi:hypothetical protein
VQIRQQDKKRSVLTIVVAALLFATTAACREPDAQANGSDSGPAKQTELVATKPTKSPAVEPVTPPQSKAASGPDARVDVPKILASREEMFRGAPSCIYTISYQDKTDHEVRWKGNNCADLKTDFMPVSDLEKFGKLDSLDKDARTILAKDHKQGVFYVEGEFTASIYPQDASGVPYEISVAD